MSAPRGGVWYRLAKVEEAIERINKRFEQSEEEERRGKRWLISAIIAATGVVIAAMGVIGVLLNSAG